MARKKQTGIERVIATAGTQAKVVTTGFAGLVMGFPPDSIRLPFADVSYKKQPCGQLK